ncbi:MAG: FG-GAP repeat domain-containing protein [Candidatus Electrothrix sp. YB6]
MKLQKIAQLSNTIRIAAEKMFRLSVVFCCLLAALPTAAGAADSTVDEEKSSKEKIIIPPFTVQTKTAETYLRTGLANILATRMAKRTGLVAVPQDIGVAEPAALVEQEDGAAVQQIIDNVPAAYVLLGSLTEQESGYIIRIHVFSRRQQAATSFSATMSNLARALPALDDLSIDIAEQVFSKPRPEKQPEAVADTGGMDGFQTAHPERMYKEGKYQQQTAEPQLAESGFSVLSARRDPLPSSSALAMDIGDLNGDGQKELVVLEHGRLNLYHTGPNGLRRIAAQLIAHHLAPHRVYLADLDKNGRQEIYIGASNGTQPASQIIEWDGRMFRFLYQNAPYYLRPGTDAAGHPVLLGQAGDWQGNGPLYRLVRENGMLQQAEKLAVPPGLMLYDFIRVDLNQDGTMEFVAVTRQNRLAVFDSNGAKIWESGDIYGAGRAILGSLGSTADGDRNPSNNPEARHLHTRLLTRDLDQDGKPEIIIGRNRLVTVKFLKRFSSFEGSSVCALRWNGSEMNTLWETPDVPSYTVDYQVIGEPARPDRFRLVFIEGEENNKLLPLWNSGEFTVHSYIMEQKVNQGGTQ